MAKNITEPIIKSIIEYIALLLIPKFSIKISILWK